MLTPHSNSFSALLEILDPQRFCRGVPVPVKHRDDVVVRRLKEDIREIQGGFPKRIVKAVTIDGLPEDAPELVLSRLLEEYRQLREQRLEGESKRIHAAAPHRKATAARMRGRRGMITRRCSAYSV